MENYTESESNNSNVMEKSSIDGNNQSSNFDCNICLELVQDPVVTLCGHLYCWSCIYKWLQSPTNVSVEQQPQCPVCKSEISDTALIPLYGRGQSSPHSKSKTRQLGILIPRRPLSPTFGIDSPRSTTSSSPSLYRDQQISYSPSYLPNPQPFYSESSSTMLSLSSIEPIIGTLEETLFARFFGSSLMNVDTSPRTYNHLEGISPRVRRHLMRANRSLNRICFFLLCCCVLCLLLF